MRIRARRPRGEFRHADVDGLGLSENAIADMHDIFSMEEYEQDLVVAQEVEEVEERTKDLQLKDVFEPSELAERLLTDEDNEIRFKDVPERLQLIRKPFKDLVLTPEEVAEEVKWMSSRLYGRKSFKRDLKTEFAKAIRKVLDLFNVDNFEVPFIYQQRKDYLIHTEKIPRERVSDGDPAYELQNEKMLIEKDLWEILDMDCQFRSFVDKRNNFKRTYQSLKDAGIEDDPSIDASLSVADSIENIQDLHDYAHFRYQSQLKDLQIANANGTRAHRRPGGGKSIFERIRESRVYSLVGAFGISAEQYAINVSVFKKREFAEDPEETPLVMAERFVEPNEFPTAESALKAAKKMLAEEIFYNPQIRNAMRLRWFMTGVMHVNPTEKGVKTIDDQHQYYVSGYRWIYYRVELTKSRNLNTFATRAFPISLNSRRCS